MYLLLMLGLAFTVHAILEASAGEEGRAEPHGSCPTCSREVINDWLICPHCSTLLRRTCSECGQQSVRWGDYCTLCGTNFDVRVR